MSIRRFFFSTSQTPLEKIRGLCMFLLFHVRCYVHLDLFHFSCQTLQKQRVDDSQGKRLLLTASFRPIDSTQIPPQLESTRHQLLKGLSWIIF